MNTGKTTLEVMNQAMWYNNWLYGLIKPYLKGEILEIGSGIGNFTKMLLKSTNVTAIDIETEYLDELKNIKSKKLSVGYGDVEKGEFFFKNKKFGCAVCLNVLEHIKGDERAMKNVYNLLNKGGKFIVLVPAHKVLFSEFDKRLGHYRRYSKIELATKLEGVGFNIAHIKYLNWWAAIGWFFWIKLLGNKNMPGTPVNIFDKLGKFFLWPEKHIAAPFGLSVFAVAQK